MINEKIKGRLTDGDNTEKIPKDTERLRGISRDSGRLRKIPEDSERFLKIPKDSKRFRAKSDEIPPSNLPLAFYNRSNKWWPFANRSTQKVK